MLPFAPRTYPFQTFQTQPRSGVFWDYGNWDRSLNSDMLHFPSDYDNDFSVAISRYHAYSDLYVRPGSTSTVTYQTKDIDLSKFSVWRFTLSVIGVSTRYFQANVGSSSRYSTSTMPINEEIVIDLTADTAITYLRFTFNKSSSTSYSVKNVRLY